MSQESEGDILRHAQWDLLLISGINKSHLFESKHALIQGSLLGTTTLPCGSCQLALELGRRHAKNLSENIRMVLVANMKHNRYQIRIFCHQFDNGQLSIGTHFEQSFRNSYSARLTNVREICTREETASLPSDGEVDFVCDDLLPVRE